MCEVKGCKGSQADSAFAGVAHADAAAREVVGGAGGDAETDGEGKGPPLDQEAG